MVSEFFNNIPKITQFIGVIDEQSFTPAPNDWLIVIADIRGSTQAVNEGRYKDVNMIGGAVICAIQNATGTRDWPFVFGGDGATLLINPAVKTSVEAALIRTRTMAREDFDLDLRIGIVPISAVRELDTDVLVARYEVSPGNCLAQFGGGGVELAETMLKSDKSPNSYAIPESTLEGLPDLTGLSCRWEALRTQKGKILCLLIKPQAHNFQQRQSILSTFLTVFADVTGSELSQASPLTEQSLRLSWPPKGLAAEAKATRGSKSYLHRIAELYFESFIHWVLERFNLTAGAYNAPRYKEELKINSDYCKFDDVLRMVIDCTPDQVVKIRALLDQMHTAGDIDFGLFETEQALMTCLLFNLESSQHLHFIDGDNGGLYTASKGLKAHLATSNKSQSA